MLLLQWFWWRHFTQLQSNHRGGQWRLGGFKNTAFLSKEDVTEVLESSLSSDIIDEVAFSIAENAIKLRATSVKEIMIPKVEILIIQIEIESYPVC